MQDNQGRSRSSVLTLTMMMACLFAGCSITSPYWGYVPASTSTPIPFQVFSVNASELQIECANDTNAHGNPTAGEASYIHVATLSPSSPASLDAAGRSLYSFSASRTLPSACWKYFGSYDFWQANVRVVLVNADGTKVPYSTYDLNGLGCLGREVGKTNNWFGASGKSCEYKYLGTTTPIPYIVMRIEGYAAGLATNSASVRSFSGAKRSSAPAPLANQRQAGVPDVAAAKPLTPELVKQAEALR
jgi:hypothetical protein